jgi:hypothetical protein
MDQLKNFWKGVLQYQFWILASLVFVVSAVVFFLTQSSLATMITGRTAKLNSTFDQIQQIKGIVPTHPNSHSHTELDKLALKLEGEVREAWNLQYNRQAKLLVWPSKAFPPGTKALEIFKNLRPIEQYVDFPVVSSTPRISKITSNDREVYRSYIGPEFAEVSKIIGTEWKAKVEAESSGFGAGGSGSGKGMGGMSSGSSEGGDGFGGPSYGGASSYGGTNVADSKDLVRWSEASQQELLNQILPWYRYPVPPSVLDIYYTQEDMWLLTGIMEIIKATNAGAVENFQTKVREIEWIRMGRYANRDAGTLTSGPSAGGMGGMGGMDSSGMGGMGGMGGMDSSGMGSEGGSMGSSDSMEGGEGGKMGGMDMGGAAGPMRPDPADGRYISFATDKEFDSVKGVDLREAIKNITAVNAVDAVAKRVPIRMRLKIDPNHLSTLIAACGNADLMLEVYQTRLNTEAAPSSGSGGGSGYGAFSSGGKGGPGMAGMGSMEGGSEGAGGMGGYGNMMGGSGGDGYGGGGLAGSMAAIKPMTEVTVEIFGLIYLYNPVNIGNLGSDKVTDGPLDQTPAVPAVSQAPVNPETQPAASPASPPAEAGKAENAAGENLGDPKPTDPDAPLAGQ